MKFIVSVMYLVGIEIGNFDYYFCENIDLSFIQKYEPDFDKYKESLLNFKNTEGVNYFNCDSDCMDLDSLDLEDYDDINCGENNVIYYKLVHFIETYFNTNLCIYTDPITDDLCDNEPLYLGVLTDDNSVKNINKIKKSYDMDTFNEMVELMNLRKAEINVYKIND